MGKRKYPPLTPSEVIAILSALGFFWKHQEGSHCAYERAACSKRKRAVVTVDTAKSEFDEFLLKSMIRQSQFERAEFYGATKSTARKAGVTQMVYS